MLKLTDFDSSILCKPNYNEELSEYLFSNNMVKTERVCAICYDDIKITELVASRCNCNLVYHRECLNSAYRDPKQNSLCLQCRKKSDILNLGITNWDKAFSQLEGILKAQECIEGILKLRQFFYEDSKKNNLLVKVFSYRKYLKYNLQDNLKNLQLNDNEWIIHALTNNQQLSEGQSTIVSQEKFQQNLQEFSYDLIGPEFDWNNVCIAGGSLFRNVHFESYKNIPDSSDIDLYIYGSKNNSDARKTVARVIKYFYKRFRDDIFYIVKAHCGILDIYVRGIARHIQLICTHAKSIPEILCEFDLTHAKLAYSKSTLWAHPDAIFALKNNISVNGDKMSSLSEDRIKKTLALNLDIKIENYKRYNDNILSLSPTMLIDDAYHPIFEESTDHIIEKLKKLSGNDVYCNANIIDLTKLSIHPIAELKKNYY